MTANLNHDDAADHDRNPQVFRTLKTPDVEIVSVLLRAPANASAALWQLLSREERHRADRFRYVEHRRRYIVARASLRRLLAERLHIAPWAVELVETSYGKPRLAPVQGSPGLVFFFSLSVAFAFFVFSCGGLV